MQYKSKYPKRVLIKKQGALFEVVWDYQSSPHTLAQRVLCERLDGFIDGFIDGALAALEIPASDIHRLGSSTGIAKNLEEGVAIKLASMFTDLFEPLIPTSHQNSSLTLKSDTLASG